ncbi:MAG: 2-dehydropantoate 2-reductase [Betaproteobacteria bacterium]
MKVCILGAGAIGGFIGTKLAAAGNCELSAIARGATLAALQTNGWRLNTAEGQIASPARAVEFATELGPQDLVIVAVKTPALTSVIPTIIALLGPSTVVLPAMNGVPWWFHTGVSALGTAPLESVDPGGRIAASVPFRHVVGCVVHASTSLESPGIVKHKMGKGLIVGEPGGGDSARVNAIAELLAAAGFDVTRSTRIRYDIWYKLWGNMTMNPISALTGSTVDRVLDDPELRQFCAAAMLEAAAIGARIGCEVLESPEDRLQVARKLGVFKTSMLQDVEAGRAIELDSLVGAVQEIGERVGVATPNISALLGLTRLFGRVRGIYPAANNAN